MSLTGTPFFVLTVAVLVLATVLLALVWNRIPGPRPLRYAGRLGATIFSQVAAVVVALVYINNTMGPFYDTWQDLFGDGANNTPVASSTSQNGGARGTGGSGDVEKLTFTTFKPGILRADAVGPASRIKGSLYVWLPPQYHQAAYAHTAFPVVELLPGTPGSPQTWFAGMDATTPLTRLIDEGRAKPMILVAATLNVLGGNTDAGCADIPGVGLTATWLAKDVPALVKQNFRAATGARQWAVMGYSAGAYCAVNLTVHHPDVFHSAVSLSGYNAPIASLVTRTPALARENNPYLVLRDDRHQPDIALLMAGSLQDPGTVPAAKALLAVLRRPGGSELLTAATGGHTTALWRTMLPDSFTWISREFG
ncbi:alpha/beta hydrolase-fold protein [Streptomyces sp. RB6PN25]|uniref:Alpha/beta hydrolase-fold protein n=1 Tax=Streptomyces humicola TaxID=2953240 RepID=A0ABT1PSI3_9ACTN|nr:alpha/beta hydrolase-fold protein [Streptomyces humicola]MCQ4080643.1 alpha/beta hydrolase-fold protein [Streptomyces humicola]